MPIDSYTLVARKIFRDLQIVQPFNSQKEVKIPKT